MIDIVKNVRELTDYPEVLRLAQVIDYTLKMQVTEVEHGYLDKIEQARSEFKESDDELNHYIPAQENTKGIVMENKDQPTLLRLKDAVKASAPLSKCLLLFRLIREYQPTTLIELGTNVGISAAFQASALKVNGKGKLTTMEGNKNKVEVAKKLLANLALDNVEIIIGKFQDTLQSCLNNVQQVDFAFIDGDHQELSTINYSNMVKQHRCPETIVVFDDIAWSEGMVRAWNTLKKDDTFNIIFAFKNFAVCYINDNIDYHFIYELPENINKYCV